MLFATMAIFPIGWADPTGFSLRLTAPCGSGGYVFIPQLRHGYAVAIRFLEFAYDVMFTCEASFNDVASSLCN